jgi:hypothetical protein
MLYSRLEEHTMITCPNCQNEEAFYYGEPSDTVTCSNAACRFTSSAMDWLCRYGSPLGDPFEILVSV